MAISLISTLSFGVIYGSHRVEQLFCESDAISRTLWKICKIAKFMFEFREGFVVLLHWPWQLALQIRSHGGLRRDIAGADFA